MSWPKGMPRKGYKVGSMAEIRKGLPAPEPAPMVVPALKADKFSPYEEVGRSGLKQVGGFLQEEFVQDLRGQKGARIYREMVDNNADLGAFLTLVKRLLQQVKWRFEPFDDSAKAKQQADWFDGALEDMEHSWPETLSEILTMLPYGYAPMEVTLKVRRGWSKDPTKRSRFDDGQIGWRKMALRKQESIFRWVYDAENRNVVSVIQIPAPVYQQLEIPMEKILNFRTDVEGANPEGRSMLRSAYYDYYWYKRLVAIAAIGAERDLNGIPVIYIPAECMAEDAPAAMRSVYTRARQIVENLRVDEQAGIVMPSQIDPESKQPLFKIELLSTTGRGGNKIDVDKMLQRHQTNMLRSVMADWMMLGTGDTGSWALSSDRTDQFGVILGGIMDIICGVMNRQAIPALAQLNGWDLNGLPKFAHGDVESQDLAKLADFLQKAGAGGFIMPDDELEDYLRENANLPARVETDEDTGINSRRKIPTPADPNQPTDPNAPEAKPGDNKPQDSKKPEPAQDQKKSVRKTPPWKVERRGDKWVVVGVENGKVYATHDTQEQAQANMRALYANVPDARKEKKE